MRIYQIHDHPYSKVRLFKFDENSENKLLEKIESETLLKGMFILRFIIFSLRETWISLAELMDSFAASYKSAPQI